MSFADFKDNTMRAVVSKTIDGVLKYVNKHDDRTEALLKLTDLSEKLMGDKFEKKVFDGARNLIHNPDAKWMKYTNKVLDEIDPHVAKMHALNLGYQAGFYGYSKTCEFEKEHGYRIPWIILMDLYRMLGSGIWSSHEPFLRRSGQHRYAGGKAGYLFLHDDRRGAADEEKRYRETGREA